MSHCKSRALILALTIQDVLCRLAAAWIISRRNVGVVMKRCKDREATPGGYAVGKKGQIVGVHDF